MRPIVKPNLYANKSALYSFWRLFRESNKSPPRNTNHKIPFVIETMILINNKAYSVSDFDPKMNFVIDIKMLVTPNIKLKKTVTHSCQQKCLCVSV